MKYTLELQQDEQSGQLIIEFPPELLNQMGWDIGDDLEWIDNKDGSYYIKLLEKANEKDCS